MDSTRRITNVAQFSTLGSSEGLPGDVHRSLGRLTSDRKKSSVDFKPALLLALALLILGLIVWLGGYPARSDAWGHLAKAEYLASVMREEGLDTFFTAAWFPNWYMGDPFRTYYPPLTTIILTPIVLLLKDPALVHHFFVILVLALFGSLTYFYLKREMGGLPAAFGASLAVWAPYQIRTLFFEGNYPRSLALLGLPLIALLLEGLIDDDKLRTPKIIGMGICWGWMILAHPQQAFIFAIAFGIYVIARLLIDPNVPLRWAVQAVTSIAVGALFASPWLLPAYSQGEFSQIPFLPLEKIELFSVPFGALIPSLSMANGQILFGLGTILMATLAAIARPSPRSSAWLVAGLITFWLSFGSKGALFSLLPLNQLLLPERFINFSAFAMAVGAAGILPIRKRAVRVRVIIIALLTLLDIVPGVALLTGQPYPEQEAHLSSLRPTLPTPDSRIALLTYPEPIATEIYFAGQRASLTTGWALENTPHHISLRRTLDAPSWGPEYFDHQMALWNVGIAVVGGPQGDSQAAEEALQEAGFFRKDDLGRYQIWKSTQAQSMVQVIPPDRMLVFGDAVAPFLKVFPFAEEAGEKPFPTGEELERYPVVGLYDFEEYGSDLLTDQSGLSQYLNRGGNLIVDISGMEDSFGATRDFLGVSALRVSFQDSIQLRWEEDIEGMPASLPLYTVPDNSWSGAIYDGLDEVLAEVNFKGRWFPMLGYKSFGEGKAWFIGMNLNYYIQLNELHDFSDRIRDLTLRDIEIHLSTRFEPIPYQHWDAGPHGVTFTIDSQISHEEALVSYTYSPRWKVMIDDQEIAFGSFENLIKVNLPAGRHQVAIEYDPYGTVWPVLGLVIGFLSYGGGAIAIIVERYRHYARTTDLPKDRPFEEVEYSPCPNCAFKLAESIRSRDIDAEFAGIRCHICGYDATQVPITPGEELTTDERNSRLSEWLRSHKYKPEIVHDVWGFIPDAFFDLDKP